MIFPDPFNDELIYSIIARLADRMGLANIEQLSRYVFGRGKVGPSPLGVPRIELMIPRLLPGSPHTGHSLVARHSLIPYYTAFRHGHTTGSVATRLMAGNRWATIGLTGKIPSPLGLRFCRRCAIESLAQGREPFWSRSHQLPGVSVCHRHLCRLEEGTTSASDARTTYLSLARVIAEAHPTREIVVRAPSDVVAEVAVFSHDLITADLSSRLANAAESFFGLLGDRGWQHQGRRDALARARLKERVLERFGSDVIKDLGIAHFWYGSAADTHPDEGSTRWISDTMAKKGRSPNPLPYLLVLLAIGSSIAELTMERVAATEPKGETEMVEVCGNPLCQAYDPLFMSKGRVPSDMAAFDAGCPTCGFVCRWYRYGADSARREIVKPGKVWDDALIEECRSGSLPIAHLMKAFGASHWTIMKRALELGIWHPLWHAGHRQRIAEAAAASQKVRRIAILEEMRAAWLRAKARLPDAGRKELGRSEPTAYYMLRRYDPEWLRRTTPRVRRMVDMKRRPPSPDDAALAERIVQAHRDISAEQPQVRMSRSLILRSLGRSNTGLPPSSYPESAKALRAMIVGGNRRGGHVGP